MKKIVTIAVQHASTFEPTKASIQSAMIVQSSDTKQNQKMYLIVG